MSKKDVKVSGYVNNKDKVMKTEHDESLVGGLRWQLYNDWQQWAQVLPLNLNEWPHPPECMHGSTKQARGSSQPENNNSNNTEKALKLHLDHLVER